MIPCNRPLLATEHTDFDAGAERMAFAVARAAGVPLAVVLPLVANAEYEAVAPDLAARQEDELHDRAMALGEAAAAAGVQAEVRIRRADEAWRAIVAHAAEHAADLLVVRRRGRRSFFANLMIGEMVGKVATQAPCNVLLVPRAAEAWRRGIVAGIDTTTQGMAVARVAAEVARVTRLPLLLASVAVHDTPAARAAAEAAVGAAAEVARAAGVAVECRVEAGRAADVVAGLAAAGGADLIVVGRGGAAAHGRLHFGSSAQRIAGLAACAVLVVRP